METVVRRHVPAEKRHPGIIVALSAIWAQVTNQRLGGTNSDSMPFSSLYRGTKKCQLLWLLSPDVLQVPNASRLHHLSQL